MDINVIVAICVLVMFYIIGFTGAVEIVPRIKIRVLTKTKLGRVLAVFFWPVAAVLSIAIVLLRELWHGAIQDLAKEFIDDWNKMMNA